MAPNNPITISSWAYDRAAQIPNLELTDNRAQRRLAAIIHGYTFVEKLQTIATKYRREQEGSTDHPNFMRQYYGHCTTMDNLPFKQLLERIKRKY